MKAVTVRNLERISIIARTRPRRLVTQQIPNPTPSSHESRALGPSALHLVEQVKIMRERAQALPSNEPPWSTT